MTVALIRTLGQLRATARQLERTVQQVEETMPAVRKAVQDAHDVLHAAGNVTERLDRITGQVEHVGGRALRLSSLVVDGVIAPVGKAAAMIQGVKVGASYLVHNVIGRRGNSRGRSGGDVR